VLIGLQRPVGRGIGRSARQTLPVSVAAQTTVAPPVATGYSDLALRDAEIMLAPMRIAAAVGEQA
jgi:hypothetical protein